MAKIFIVEDEWLVALELQERIQDLGYESVGSVDNGASAIEKVLKSKPDLILMDINIKGDIDGIETARQIQQKFNVPVIYLTAYSDNATLERAKITTPYGYIVKPVDERDLKIAIEISLQVYEMEKKLIESEKNLSITLKSIGEGVIATDSKSIITRMNTAAEKMCGIPEEQAVGLPLTQVFNIISAKDRKPLDTPIEEVLKTGKVVERSNHTILVSKDGTERHIANNAAPIMDDLGEIHGIVLVFSDVTEAFVNRKLLKESEKLYREVIENASDVIFTTNPVGKFIYTNAAATKLTGYLKEDLEGRNFAETVVPEYRLQVKHHYYRQFLKKETTTYLELPIIKKNQESIWLGQNVTLILNNGKVSGFQVVSRDITERKKLELSLIEAKEKAETANDLKDAFIANISHEIRTPLNGLLGMTEILKDVFAEHITSEEEHYFDAINRSSKRIIRTIDMILNFSRLQIGDFQSDPKIVNLDELLNELHVELSFLAKQKGLSLTFENKIGKTLIHSDNFCLNQIVTNLVDNAIKYTNKGTIKIVLYRDLSNRIRIDISDTGIGISEDYLAQLFQPYTQEKNGYSRPYEGVGLGLSLVKKFLFLIDADISVASQKNVGSTFTVIFKESSKGE